MIARSQPLRAAFGVVAVGFVATMLATLPDSGWARSNPAPPVVQPHDDGPPPYGIASGEVWFEDHHRMLRHVHGRAVVRSTLLRLTVDSAGGVVYIGGDSRTRLAPSFGSEIALRQGAPAHHLTGRETIATTPDTATVAWTVVGPAKVTVYAYDVPAGRMVAAIEVRRTKELGLAHVIGMAGDLVFVDQANGTWVWTFHPGAGPNYVRLTNHAGRITSVGAGVLGRSPAGRVIESGRRFLGPEWTILKVAARQVVSPDGRFTVKETRHGDLRARRLTPDADWFDITQRGQRQPPRPMQWTFTTDGHLAMTVPAPRGSAILDCHLRSGRCSKTLVVTADTPLLIR